MKKEPQESKVKKENHGNGGSLQAIVGISTYQVWTEMLSRLVPDGRSHRLAPLVAGMLKCAADIAYEKSGKNPKEGTIAHSLIYGMEEFEPEEPDNDIRDIVRQLFEDAKVKHKRTSRRGEEYDLIDRIIQEYVNWHNMPWERY